MKKFFLNRLFLFPVVSLLIMGSSPLFAEESIGDLKKQIEALRAEVAELKAAQQQTPNVETAAPPARFSTYSAFHDPFAQMQQMHDRMNQLFADSFRRSSSFFDDSDADFALFYEPSMDVQDEKDHYLIKVDLPGMDKDKINVEVTEHFIDITGERASESNERDNARGFYQMERRFGSFSRRLPMPEDTIADKIDAKYENGVLTIKLNKKDSGKKDKSVAKKVAVS
jgi:HSP20 family protein